MPYQIKNGIIYSGNAVTLTQAQYDALTTAEKNNGTVYYIYDSDAMIEAQEVGLDGGNVEDLAGSVATIETSPATANHEVGEYILWNGVLYTVTSAIATGENLVVNSNISATTVGEELTALNNGLTVKQTSLSNSTYLSTNIKVFRQANFVNVIYAGDAKKIDARAWIALGTLPTGYRPAEYINVLVRSNNTVWLRISTAGVIEYYTTTSASVASNFQFQVTYYTPDAMP